VQKCLVGLVPEASEGKACLEGPISPRPRVFFGPLSLQPFGFLAAVIAVGSLEGRAF
jgi:hypothetical protein